jgi:hypothetical protein
MPKHNAKKAPRPTVKKAAPARKRPEPAAELRQALSRRPKEELVEVLLELAEADRGILRQLTAKFDVAAAPDALVAATRQAIADATVFDKRDINRNFDYDYAAYDEVKRNLSRLIDLGQLGTAMQLSLELMEHGSYQVEMSDEGMMTEDIEGCLSVVLESVGKGGLPSDQVNTWCSAMIDKDRVKFIAEKQLRSLRSRARSAAAK